MIFGASTSLTLLQLYWAKLVMAQVLKVSSNERKKVNLLGNSVFLALHVGHSYIMKVKIAMIIDLDNI